MNRPVLSINLDAIAANWRALDALGPAETAAVVKADAYGLGVENVAPALFAAGAKTFFVASAPEATALRAVVGRAPVIYVLNGASEGLSEISAAEARPVLNAVWEIGAVQAFARALGRPIDVALQIETGMNRLGLTTDALRQLVETCALGGLDAMEVCLIMSHLADADARGSPLTKTQAACFADALPKLRENFPGAVISLAATGGAVHEPALHYDLIRPGVGLFGGAPFAAAKPVVRLEAPILRVWDVAAGERSGYGGAWTAARPSRLATIPVGYADGFPRALSNRGRAKVAGRIVPFAGRVSMDLIVLDVTDAPSIAPGDVATLLDEELTVDHVAALASTIGYEMLTSLGDRYIRRYNRAD